MGWGRVLRVGLKNKAYGFKERLQKALFPGYQQDLNSKDEDEVKRYTNELFTIFNTEISEIENNLESDRNWPQNLYKNTLILEFSDLL